MSSSEPQAPLPVIEIKHRWAHLHQNSPPRSESGFGEGPRVGGRLYVLVAGRAGRLSSAPAPRKPPRARGAGPRLGSAVSLLAGLDLCPFWELCPDPSETKPGALSGAPAAPVLPHHSLINGYDLSVCLLAPRSCHLCGGRDGSSQSGTWFSKYLLNQWFPHHSP